jgi:hypothetical protein
VNQSPLQLIWGCDPRRQLEVTWLHHLIGAYPFEEWCAGALDSAHLRCVQPRLLVESGLLRLEREPSPERLSSQRKGRAQRLKLLAEHGPFTLVHLSDEEGLDGDELYPMLPIGTPIWRNFPYPRFSVPGLASGTSVMNFPIGPRAEFFGQPSPTAASARPLPWSFMGTLWGSGSRLLATALFLRALPHGFFYGGSSFSMGLPLHRYRTVLAQSVFALCPEGDRHLDTFRLYESLQMGCLPLVVDRANQALPLLGLDYPLPVFSSWPEALGFAQERLVQPQVLDGLQGLVAAWWQSRCDQLSTALRSSFRTA